MNDTQTETIDPAGTIPERKRSGLVTTSGVVVLLMPVIVAGSFLWAAVRQGRSALMDSAAFAASTLVLIAVFAVTGNAILRRWRGWRFYAGAMGWFLIAVALRFLSVLPRSMASGFDTADVWLFVPVSILGLIGVFVLLAKRDEPPAKPFSPVTLMGVALVLFGLLYLVVASSAPDLSAATPLLVLTAVFALAGAVVILRWRGWRIYAGFIAWCAIAVSVAYALAQFVQVTPGSLSLLRWVEDIEAPLILLAFGCFILWAKRQEPAQA